MREIFGGRDKAVEAEGVSRREIIASLKTDLTPYYHVYLPRLSKEHPEPFTILNQQTIDALCAEVERLSAQETSVECRNARLDTTLVAQSFILSLVPFQDGMSEEPATACAALVEEQAHTFHLSPADTPPTIPYIRAIAVDLEHPPQTRVANILCSAIIQALGHEAFFRELPDALKQKLFSRIDVSVTSCLLERFVDAEVAKREVVSIAQSFVAEMNTKMRHDLEEVYVNTDVPEEDRPRYTITNLIRGVYAADHDAFINIATAVAQNMM